MIYSNCLSALSLGLLRLPRLWDPRNDLAFYKLYVISRGAQANWKRCEPRKASA